MREAYKRYQQIVTSDKAALITDVNKLARLIRCDLQDKPTVARGIVNNWYSDNAELYVGQVLQSKMGDHQDQSRVFNLLSRDRTPTLHFAMEYLERPHGCIPSQRICAIRKIPPCPGRGGRNQTRPRTFSHRDGGYRQHDKPQLQPLQFCSSPLLYT